jgi:hypothetical protein
MVIGFLCGLLISSENAGDVFLQNVWPFLNYTVLQHRSFIFIAVLRIAARGRHEVAGFLCGLLIDPENGGDIFPQNIQPLPNYTVLECSSLLIVASLLKARIVKSTDTVIARERLCKHAHCWAVAWYMSHDSSHAYVCRS